MWRPKQLSPIQQRQLEHLGHKNTDGALTRSERRTLVRLVRLAEVLTLENARDMADRFTPEEAQEIMKNLEAERC